jgi:uncharacterized protein YbgA (DUF1722 family)
MLKNLQRQETVNALRSMVDSLPKILNSREIDILLRNSQDYRTKAISTIVQNFASNLDGDDLATILGDASRQDSLVALQAISVAGKIKQNLSSVEAHKILSNTQDYRTKSIAVLAPYLAGNLGGNDLAAILGDASRQDSLVALQAISVAGKIKQNLNAADASKILSNTQDYRTKSIGVLAPYLAGNLGGSDLAVILGDASRQDGLVALQAISVAGRIRKNLTAEESNKTLANTQDYRTKSIAVLAPYLDGNLGGGDLATVLGDASRQDRLIALEAISVAGRIKQNLTAEEASKVLFNAQDYRTKCIAVLAPNLVGNLGGNDLATALGDTSRQDRFMALSSFIRQGKVKRGLKPNETQLVLQGMGDYSSKAMAELAPFLSK